MLRKSHLAIALALALIVSMAALPATAAPAAQQMEAPSIASAAIGWILQAVGLEAPNDGARSKSELGIILTPDGQENDSEDVMTTTSDDGSDDPDSELGIILTPGG